MTAMLRELADRVEAATGPDRSIDHLIGAAIGWRDEHTILDPVPMFTASVHAAKSLNPGWVWMGINEHPDATWSCSLGHAQFEEPVYGIAKTEELARTAAALKARAHAGDE